MNNLISGLDNETYKSYFHTYKTIYGDDIDGLETVSHMHKKYVGEKYIDDPIMCRIQRTHYVEHINHWLDQPLFDGITNDNNDYDEDYDEDYLENYTTNATVIRNIYDDICKALSESELEIDDVKQFKEDLIHFIYTLSDLE